MKIVTISIDIYVDDDASEDEVDYIAREICSLPLDTEHSRYDGLAFSECLDSYNIIM